MTDTNDAKNEIEAIKKVIRTSYLEGIHNEGDLEKIDAGFHPDFQLLGLKDGREIWKFPITEWKELIIRDREDGKFPYSGDDLKSIKFISVDVTGTAAVAKFELYIGRELRFIDFLLLYKFDQGWLLVGKTYYEIPD